MAIGKDLETSHTSSAGEPTGGHGTEGAPEACARRTEPPITTREEQQRQQAGNAIAAAFPLAIGRRQLLALRHLHDLLQSGAHAAVDIALAKQRRDGVVDDALGRDIGQHAFQAVADLDAHRAVLHRHQQQHAVVRLFAPQLPGFGHADRILLDGLGLGGLHHEQRDLRALALLEGSQLLLQFRLLCGGQRAGEIGDPRFERGHRLQFLRGKACREQQPAPAGR